MKLERMNVNRERDKDEYSYDKWNFENISEMHLLIFVEVWKKNNQFLRIQKFFETCS